MVEDNKIMIEGLKRKNLYKNIIIFALCILLTITTTIAFMNDKIKQTSKEPKKVTNGQYNSKYKLDLVSAYGDIEAYHPKVLAFDEKWNGYYYWMSFTPYPDSDESKENPHIVASNNLVNWEVPKGLKNPIDEVEDTNKNKYNSDSHIVMNEKLNRMECYWRYVNDETNEAVIYRKYTTDGIHWSDKEVAIKSDNRKKKDYISPAIIYDNGIYKMWYLDKGNTLKYTESNTGTSGWKESRVINLEYPKPLKSWHMDVIKTEQGYEMVMMAYESVKKRGDASLYYSKSGDNTNWSKCTEIIKPTIGTKYWDNRGIYRSSVIKKDGIYYVFYSASNKKNIKGIGIMYGKNINNLHKIDIDYTNDEDAEERFKKLIEEEKNL